MTHAIVESPANLPMLTEGQPSNLYTDRSGRLHTGDAPFSGADLVVLSADTTFTAPPRAIYIGTAGDLKVDMLARDGATVLTAKIIKVTDFQVLPFANIKKIYSTANGTTASNIIVGA